MKKNLLFLLLFGALQLSAQWNTLGWNPYLLRDTEGDSTFVLSAPSRADLQEGVATWVPSSPGYLEYVALLTQEGTDAPVATVLSNTLGFTPFWVYVGVGFYKINNSTSFDNYTVGQIFVLNGSPSSSAASVQSYYSDEEHYVYVKTRQDQDADGIVEESELSDNVLSDGDGFSKTVIIIRIYP